jgi:hypothetical protein
VVDELLGRHLLPRLGSGRMDVSEIEAPNILVDLV